MILIVSFSTQSIAKQELPRPSWEQLHPDFDLNTLEPYSVPCETHGCRGIIRTLKVGTGAWMYDSSEQCGVHHRCTKVIEVRNVYYEDFCTGTCGLNVSYSVQEKNTYHVSY